MDTINAYLNNMFLNLKLTPEVLRAKEELGQMMEDKYLELKARGYSENEAVGQVIAEFGDLRDLEEELGLRQDPGYARVADDPDSRTLSYDQAFGFIGQRIRSSARVALGDALSVAAPVPLILLLHRVPQIPEHSRSSADLWVFSR